MPNSNGSVARFENETTLRKNEAKPQKNGILRDNSTNKQVNCADPSDDKWLSFHVFPTLLGKKSKNVFRFFEFRLGINFFHFRLGRFEKVGERLGSPEAGVEIGTG